MDGELPGDITLAGVPEDATARVTAVQEAANEVLADGQVYAASTPQGEVHICEVSTGTDGTLSWVDVHLHGETAGGDPHFRIFNPPILVPDPHGSVDVGGRTYREDPLGAVAQVIATQGGAAPVRGRRLR